MAEFSKVVLEEMAAGLVEAGEIERRRQLPEHVDRLERAIAHLRQTQVAIAIEEQAMAMSQRRLAILKTQANLAQIDYEAALAEAIKVTPPLTSPVEANELPAPREPDPFEFAPAPLELAKEEG